AAAVSAVRAGRTGRRVVLDGSGRRSKGTVGVNAAANRKTCGSAICAVVEHSTVLELHRTGRGDRAPASRAAVRRSPAEFKLSILEIKAAARVDASAIGR